MAGGSRSGRERRPRTRSDCTDEIIFEGLVFPACFSDSQPSAFSTAIPPTPAPATLRNSRRVDFVLTLSFLPYSLRPPHHFLGKDTIAPRTSIFLRYPISQDAFCAKQPWPLLRRPIDGGGESQKIKYTTGAPVRVDSPLPYPPGTDQPHDQGAQGREEHQRRYARCYPTRDC
jgi:hypothetical protein